MTYLRRSMQSNWLWLLVLIFLIAFPFIVGVISGDSPFGQLRGNTYRQVGQSVFWQLILIETFILCALAMSYNVLFGFTGVISFGHALFFGMGGYLMAIMLEKAGLPMEIGWIGGLIIGLIFCAVIGFVVGLVSLRLKGVYFAMFTLAVAEAFFIYFGRLPATNAEDGFPVQNLPTFLDPQQSRLSYYYIVLAFAVFTFLFIRRLMLSPTGAVLLAIRENEERAQAIGYNTLRYKLLAIVLSAMLAGASGMFQVILKKKVGPEVLNVQYTVDPLLMTIIGGTGTFAGPIVGAASLHLLDSRLRNPIQIGGMTINISDSWNLILGIIFVVVVMIFPQGIVGTWLKWRGRRKANGRGDPNDAAAGKGKIGAVTGA